MLLQSFKKYEKPELHTNQAQKLTQNGERKKSAHTRGEKTTTNKTEYIYKQWFKINM